MPALRPVRSRSTVLLVDVLGKRHNVITGPRLLAPSVPELPLHKVPRLRDRDVFRLAELCVVADEAREVVSLLSGRRAVLPEPCDPRRIPISIVPVRLRFLGRDEVEQPEGCWCRRDLARRSALRPPIRAAVRMEARWRDQIPFTVAFDVEAWRWVLVGDLEFGR